MPEDILIDDLITELLFLEKVDRGLKDIDEGETLNHGTAEIIKMVRLIRTEPAIDDLNNIAEFIALYEAGM